MNKKNKNSGFSLIELVIAIAVLSFLMLAVSSFMGSSVMHTKKTKVEVRMQAQAQETYSLITDSIMQASDIVIGGYTVASTDEEKMDFINLDSVGTDVGVGLTKKYYVKDKATADAIEANPALYGLTETVSSSDFVYFSDLDPATNIYVTFLRVESSVPIDITNIPSGNAAADEQNITNSITGETVKLIRKDVDGEKVYTMNDTLISTFYFEGENMYYGRQYTFMTDANDQVDMSDADSKYAHLYSKYFAYVQGSEGAVLRDVSGCVANVNTEAGTIGINLTYNQSSMSYETVGRVNTRNTYVLRSRK